MFALAVVGYLLCRLLFAGWLEWRHPGAMALKGKLLGLMRADRADDEQQVLRCYESIREASRAGAGDEYMVRREGFACWVMARRARAAGDATLAAAVFAHAQELTKGCLTRRAKQVLANVMAELAETLAEDDPASAGHALYELQRIADRGTDERWLFACTRRELDRALSARCSKLCEQLSAEGGDAERIVAGLEELERLTYVDVPGAHRAHVSAMNAVVPSVLESGDEQTLRQILDGLERRVARLAKHPEAAHWSPALGPPEDLEDRELATMMRIIGSIAEQAVGAADRERARCVESKMLELFPALDAKRGTH